MTDHTTPLRGEAARTASSPPAEAPRFVAAVPHWLRVSLARRLMLGLAVALLASAALLVVLALAIGRDSLRRQHEAAAQRVAHLFEASLQNAMLKRDLDGMAGILASLGQSSGVTQARLLAPNGAVRFASQPQAGAPMPGRRSTGCACTPAAPPRRHACNGGRCRRASSCRSLTRSTTSRAARSATAWPARTR